MRGRYSVPPLAIAEIAEMIWTGVTLTSWPIASEPIELAVQFSIGRSKPRFSPGQLDASQLTDAEVANRVVEPRRAQPQSDFDRADVARVRENSAHASESRTASSRESACPETRILPIWQSTSSSGFVHAVLDRARQRDHLECRSRVRTRRSRRDPCATSSEYEPALFGSNVGQFATARSSPVFGS